MEIKDSVLPLYTSTVEASAHAAAEQRKPGRTHRMMEGEEFTGVCWWCSRMKCEVLVLQQLYIFCSDSPKCCKTNTNNVNDPQTLDPCWLQYPSIENYIW